MDVLVIGGSVFLGRAVVDEALALGSDATVVNRGRSGPTPQGERELLAPGPLADQVSSVVAAATCAVAATTEETVMGEPLTCAQPTPHGP